VELVVRGEGEQDTKTRSEREEDLRGCVHPHFGFGDGVEVGSQVVLDALGGTWQGHAPDQKRQQHHVREDGCEPHDLARSRDALPQRKVANQVDDQQARCHVPLDFAHVFDAGALVHLQDVSTEKLSSIYIIRFHAYFGSCSDEVFGKNIAL
jgi:hypothetical protein